MYDRSLVWTLSPLLAQPVIDSPKQPLFDWGFLLIHGQASAIRIRIARTLIGKRKINVRCMLNKETHPRKISFAGESCLWRAVLLDHDGETHCAESF